MVDATREGSSPAGLRRLARAAPFSGAAGALGALALLLAGRAAAALAAAVVAAALFGIGHLARALARARLELDGQERLVRQALRVEAAGRLAGLIVHRMRNHVQVLAGHASIGSLAAADEKDLRFERIRAELAELRGLMDRVLEFAHPGEEDRPERVDLVRACTAFAETVRRMLPAAVALHVELPAAPLEVAVDPRDLEHALLNLVLNAVDAMEGRGRLSLRLARSGRTARLSIEDTGCGIAPEERRRIFEPYVTSKAPGRGTGLGLVAVARFARAAGGRIELVSGIGRGSTFTLHLPLAPAAASPRGQGSLATG